MYFSGSIKPVEKKDMREGLDGFQGFFIFREHLDPADALRGCSALNRADFFAGIGRVDDPDLFYCILHTRVKKTGWTISRILFLPKQAMII